MTDIRRLLKKPFWAAKDDLPSWDFCREIIEPSTNEMFPDGALGLRVDDDFWAVAALPIEYVDWKLENIVEVLWPNSWRATFHPDSGTLEQRVEQLEAMVYSAKRENSGLHSQMRSLEKEMRRHGYLAHRETLSTAVPEESS